MKKTMISFSEESEDKAQQHNEESCIICFEKCICEHIMFCSSCIKIVDGDNKCSICKTSVKLIQNDENKIINTSPFKNISKPIINKPIIGPCK